MLPAVEKIRSLLRKPISKCLDAQRVAAIDESQENLCDHAVAFIALLPANEILRRSKNNCENNMFYKRDEETFKFHTVSEPLRTDVNFIAPILAIREKCICLQKTGKTRTRPTSIT